MRDSKQILSLARDTMDTLRAYAEVPVEDGYSGPIPVDLPWLYGWRVCVPGVVYEFRYRPVILRNVLEVRTMSRRGTWSDFRELANVRNVQHAQVVAAEYMRGIDPQT